MAYLWCCEAFLNWSLTGGIQIEAADLIQNMALI